MNLSAFLQSFFLQSLGWAIAHSLWQAAILLAVYKFIVSGYRNATPKFKNNLSTALLFGNFLWFIATFLSKFIGSGATGANKPGVYAYYYANPEHISNSIDLQGFISAVITTLPYLSLAYLLLLSILVIKLGNSYRSIQFLKNNGLERPAAEWLLFVEEAARHIFFSKKIKIWFSKYIDVPATMGFFKPVILIPLASVNQLTPDQMEAIILHEMCHIKNNDFLINLFVALIETVLFFNPFVVLLCNIVKKERENCCDDFVLQYRYDRHSYASALLVLEKSREHQLSLALSATSGKKQLLLRIKRIMEATSTRGDFNYGQKLLALILVTSVICSLAWLAPEKKSDQAPARPPRVKASTVTQPLIIPKTIDIVPPKKANKVNPGTLSPRKDDDKNLLKPSPMPSLEGVDQDNGFNLNFDSDEYTGKTAGISPGNNAFFPPESVPVAAEAASVNNFLVAPGAPLPELKVIEDLFQNISVDKLKDNFEKNKALWSAEWANIKRHADDYLKKINLLQFDINVQNNKINFTAPGKAPKKPGSSQFEPEVYKNLLTPEGQGVGLYRDDSLVFYIARDGRNFFDAQAGGSDVKPAHLVKANRARANRPATTEAEQQGYRYQYTPKTKTQISTSVQIEHEKDRIIIDGKKMRLSDLDRAALEKIIRKARKVVIEI